MASHAPAACCSKTTLHEGTPVGKLVDELYGYETYVTGDKNGKIIVILTDIFGHRYNNIQLIADNFAQKGYYVLIPDILSGDAFIPGKHQFETWFPNHSPELTRSIVEKFLQGLEKDIKIEFLGVIGYCFGAKYAVQQMGKGSIISAGAVAHPSFVSIEEVSQVAKPLLISAAETDDIFPLELRTQTETKLKEIKARYQIDLFSGVSHGYACRGDPKVEVQKYAKEKTFCDQLYWFDYFTSN